MGCANGLTIIVNLFICQNHVENLQYIQYIQPANMQMQIPVPRKPNSSSIFTGRKDILNKLGKVFAPRASNRLIPRRSCLLWGLGGIGKTQICLKFTEEESAR